MTLSEKVLAAAEKHGVLKSDLDKLDKQLSAVLVDMEKDGADEEVLLPQIDELTAQIEVLRPEVEASEKRVTALKSAEAALAARATPVTSGAPGIIKTHPRLAPVHKAGDIFVRIAVVKALAKISGSPVHEILDSRYGQDDSIKAIFDWMQKTAVAAADTTTTGWAKELVRNDMQGFLDMLKNISIGAGLATRSMMLDFNGAGTVTIPKLNNLAGTETEPAWVGEGGAIPLQRFTFGSSTLARYKLASIVPFTNELIQQSTPAVEAIIRRAMEESYAQMLDRALLAPTPGGAAVAGVRPASLRIGESTAAGQTTGTGIENLIADITAMLTALASAGLGQRPVLVLNDTDYISASMLVNPLGQMMFRDELNGGRLLGVEVLHSQNATSGVAMMVDVSALATAFDGPEFMVSEQATLTMANADGTAPTQAGDAAGVLVSGTPGQVVPDGGISVSGGVTGTATAGYAAQSLFQRYSTAIRGVWPTSWGLMRTGAVVSRTSIDWK